ncbi:MAG: hypothetical protein EP330_19215 [Deltaproteobacteria bacterium]|nr:MAG: hypothetical protein EP330_19215 [Deltaproteobacteria bacterium]
MSSLIIPLAGLGALACLGMLGLGILGKRVPVIGYVGLPLLVLILTSLAVRGVGASTLTGLEAGDITQLDMLANSGLRDALATAASGRMAAAGVLVLATWCAAIPAIVRSGKDWGWTFVDAVFAVILIIGASVAVLVLGSQWGAAGQMTPVLGVVVVGGFGIVVASLRRGLFDDAERVAALRFAAGVAFLGAVGQIGHYVALTAEVTAIDNALQASPDSIDTTLIAGLETMNVVTNLSWIAWAFGFLIALCALFMELGEAVQKYMIIDGAAITALAAMMLVARGAELTKTWEVREVGNLGPMVQVLDEIGVELPAAAIAMKGALVDARPAGGGFGDLLVLQKDEVEEGADQTMSWVRRYKWNGQGWDEDETPLAQAQLSNRPVLLAANASMPAENLFTAMQAAPAGAMLLVRMGEINKDVPEMAMSRNAAYLPLAASTQADPTNQLWARADKRGLYNGPVRWYGDGDEEKDLLAQTDSAFEQTESPGMTLLVNDRAMIRQVADYCLASLMTAQDDTVVPREGTWCELSQETFEDFRATAVEGWEVPSPRPLRYAKTVDKRLPEGYGDYLDYEVDALAYCQQKAVDFGEEEGLEGLYKASFEVTKKGKIGWFEVDGKTKVENRPMRKCIKKRIDDIVWPEHEVETDEEKEDDYVTIEFSVTYGKAPEPSEDAELDEEGEGEGEE